MSDDETDVLEQRILQLEAENAQLKSDFNDAQERIQFWMDQANSTRRHEHDYTDNGRIPRSYDDAEHNSY